MPKTQKRYGIAAHPDYRLWANMRNRCSNPNHPNYQNYGGRGITVCDRWQSFRNFIADLGARPSSDYSIDRLDVEGNYEPNNCQWATRPEQDNNKTNSHLITYQGRTQTLTQWAKEVGINYQTIFNRLKVGWSVAEALTLPPYGRRKKAA